MKKARITVLKCMDNRKIQEEQRIGGYSGPCDAFAVGQSFVAGWDVPEGFCAFAYAQIHNDLRMIQSGGSPGYIEPENTMGSGDTILNSQAPGQFFELCAAQQRWRQSISPFIESACSLLRREQGRERQVFDRSRAG